MEPLRDYRNIRQLPLVGRTYNIINDGKQYVRSMYSMGEPS